MTPIFWRGEPDRQLEVSSRGQQVDIVIFDGLQQSLSEHEPPNKDVLAKNLPDTRILTWGSTGDVFEGPPAKVAYFAYQALLRLRDTRASHEEQQRPIILVGVSLGGLILKHALFCAVADPEFESIVKHIQAMLFVATPHREDADQGYGRILTSVARTTTYDQRINRICDELDDNSEVFRGLTSAWHLIPDIPVYSFSETNPMDSFYGVVVRKHSATLGIENEVHVSIDATHVELASLLTDPAYSAVYSTLKTLTRREHLQRTNRISESQRSQPSQLWSRLFEYCCPVCTSFPSGDLPVGIDAPPLEYLVDFDPSMAKKLKAWSRVCAVANFAYRILVAWSPCQDEAVTIARDIVYYSVSHYASCVHPPSDQGAQFMLSTEHDVPFNTDFRCVVHADPLSETTKRHMRSWIDGCDDGHNEQFCVCSRYPASNFLRSQTHESERTAPLKDLLPSRLLDVSDLRHIRLCEREDFWESDVGKGYATLSHCWGSSGSFLTTTESLPMMKEGFDLSSQMPKTFRDAIVVAHELGIRYLWIDSLCIIQDDISDWDHEASKMARVYSRAYLNISALDSDDDAKGFLHPRPFQYTTLRFTSPTGQSATAYLSKRRTNSTPSPQPEHVLKTRGWVLQEQYLSPRILWFSSTHIGWKCRSREKEEDRKPLFTPGIDLRLRNWMKILTDFTSRSLTYDTDKLPAIAGVAPAAFTGQPRGIYCAGIWQNHLPGGLLFFWKNPTSPSEYIAPSWSWAALNGPMEWVDQYGESRLCHGVMVVDFHMNLVSNNQYGRVREGSSLTIMGYLMPLRPWLSATREAQGLTWEMYEAVDGGNKSQEIWCKFDLPHIKPREVTGLLLLERREENMRPWNKPPPEFGLLGLLLMPVEGGYKRIGIFQTRWTGRWEAMGEIINNYSLGEVVLY